jgi:hypothetical protein
MTAVSLRAMIIPETTIFHSPGVHAWVTSADRSVSPVHRALVDEFRQAFVSGIDTQELKLRGKPRERDLLIHSRGNPGVNAWARENTNPHCQIWYAR